MNSVLRRLSLLGCLTALCVVPAALAQSETGGVPLPVRKIVLYKNGMGYFERLGDVRGAAVDLVLSSAQLNDVLKSLTVIDLAPAPIASVTY